MHIRCALPDDLPAILGLSNHYAATTAANFAVEPESINDWQRSFEQTHETHPWLVAVDRDGDGGSSGLLGFAKASPWKGRCAYEFAAEVTVYVAPEQHGRGIGRALYERLFEILRAQGYRTLLGGITLPNDASVRLHEAMGMHRAALFEQIGWKFGMWHDVGYWLINLAGDSPPPDGGIRRVGEVF